MKRVLVVDDDKGVRALLGRALAAFGWLATTAATPSEALALFEAQAIDLVVLDVILPESNGCELLRRLHERRAGLPALFISGYPRAYLADQEQYREATTAFLQKPFSVRAFVAALEHLIRDVRADTGLTPDGGTRHPARPPRSTSSNGDPFRSWTPPQS